MVTAIAQAYDVVSLEDIEPGPEHDGRVPLNIRRHFDIRGFGVRANRSVGDGYVVGEHDEVGLGASGQEELYLVLSGKATFNVDGRRAVFEILASSVRNPFLLRELNQFRCPAAL